MGIRLRSTENGGSTLASYTRAAYLLSLEFSGDGETAGATIITRCSANWQTPWGVGAHADQRRTIPCRSPQGAPRYWISQGGHTPTLPMGRQDAGSVDPFTIKRLVTNFGLLRSSAAGGRDDGWSETSITTLEARRRNEAAACSKARQRGVTGRRLVGRAAKARVPCARRRA